MAKKKIKTNPNGANQYVLDVRQGKCWEAYINPKSDTYGNAFRSAIKAGYTKQFARQVTSFEWFVEKTRRMNLLHKAEKVLEETITMTTVLPVIGQFGPVMLETGEIDEKGKMIRKVLFGENDKLLKIKQDSAKFVAERLGKKKGYSTRTEITGEDGAPLPSPIFGGTAL